MSVLSLVEVRCVQCKDEMAAFCELQSSVHALEGVNSSLTTGSCLCAILGLAP